jgi:GT2 family glycosyltransferase
VGLQATTTEFVHFIDDDSNVTPDYFARIISTFASRPDAVAVGGLQLRALLVAPHWTKRLFLLDTKPGRVSKAGANSLVYSILDNPQEVDWLSGCAMSFRTRAAVSTQFNEALPGYALGEDLEFCLRVRRHGSILINTEAWVDHVRSETNRLDYRRFRSADVAHRALFVRSFPERFSWAAYAWSILGLTLLTSVRRLRGADGAADELRGIADGLRILRSGRLAS